MTVTAIFLSQKRVNVCEHTTREFLKGATFYISLHSFLLQPPGGTFQKLSSDAIFVLCSHTYILFWLRKMAVTVKIFRLSFRVFACAFPLEISSIFGIILTIYFNIIAYYYFSFFIDLVHQILGGLLTGALYLLLESWRLVNYLTLLTIMNMLLKYLKTYCNTIL